MSRNAPENVARRCIHATKILDAKKEKAQLMLGIYTPGSSLSHNTRSIKKIHGSSRTRLLTFKKKTCVRDMDSPTPMENGTYLVEWGWTIPTAVAASVFFLSTKIDQE